MKYSWLKSFFFSSLSGVNHLSSSKWGIQAVGHPCVLTAEAQTAVFFSLPPSVASYERVLCSCSQLSWEIIIMAFIYLHQLFWSVDVRGNDRGRGRARAEEKWLVAWRQVVTVRPSLPSPSSPSPRRLHSRYIPLFLRMPGMPPVFLCSNYCLCKKNKTKKRKLCQRAEIVLMRGPAAFASVIWWISLGTHKTRRTRGLAATSKPPGVAVCYY